MNKRWHLASLVGLMVLANQGFAQFRQINPPNYGPGYRPNISPYLNLQRNQARGNQTNAINFGLDYFLGTRSEFARRQDASQFRNEFRDLRIANEVLGNELEDEAGQQPVRSGTRTLMNNTGGYFNNTLGFFSGGARIQTPRPSGRLPAPQRRSRGMGIPAGLGMPGQTGRAATPR